MSLLGEKEIRDFLNLAFGLNPVPTLTMPYSTLGAGLWYMPNEDSYLSLSIYDPEGDPSETGFDSFFENGVTIAVEARIGTELFGRRGHQLLGAEWRHVHDEEDSWTLWYNFDQYLLGGEAGRGLGIFGRFGIANEDTNLAKRFYSLGLGGKGMVPGREYDRFGLGYYYLEYADDLAGLLCGDGNEQGVEVYYEFAITPWWSITADLQILDSPLDVETAIVAGVRSRFEF